MWLTEQHVEEVKTTLFSFNISKSPELDGFTAKFFKENWNEIKGIIMECVNTLLILIPKTPTATDMGDLRHICCVNHIYKV